MNKKRTYIFPIILILLIPVTFTALIFGVAKMLDWELSLYNYDSSNPGHPAPPMFSIMAGALFLLVLLFIWIFVLIPAIISIKRIRLNNKLFYISGIKDKSIPAEGDYMISRKHNMLKVALWYMILLIIPILTFIFLSHRLAILYVVIIIILAVKSLCDADRIPQHISIDKQCLCIEDMSYELKNISRLLFTVKSHSLDIYTNDNACDRVYLGTYDGILDSGTLSVLLTIIRACSEKDIRFDFHK